MRFAFAFALLAMAIPAALAATDPKDDVTDPARDIISYSVTAAGDAAVVELTVAADWNFNAVQVFFDTEAGKGFNIAGMGADLMVEGATIYRYGGTGEDWTWQRIGEARRQVAARKLVLRAGRDLIRAERARIIMRTLSDDWQTVLDTAPDNSTVSFSFTDSPAGVEAAQADKVQTPPGAGNDDADPAGDADDPTLDITAFEAAQDGADLVIQLKAKQAGDFGTWLLLIDTDRSADTGFQPPADPRFGFELLISGDQLLKHTGATRDAWQWERIGAARRTLTGNALTLRIEAGLLRSQQIDIAAWAMSKDWQTLVDRAPDQGLKRVKIDPAAAGTAAPRPQAQMAPPKANRHLPARQRVRQAQNFYCYYGSGRVAELSHYDLVILHTPQMSSEDVKALRELGVVTIGYITVGEDDPAQARKGDGTGPGGFASWYFDDDNDGQPDRNPIWRSFYVNANDPAWRADCVAEARRLVHEYGFDGIFLDTLDTATARPHTRPGMIQLVADLRAALPDAPIILNQGFSMLPELAPLADGLMLESFTATYDFDSKSYMMNYPQSIDYHLMRVQKDIQPVLEKHPLTVLVLDYAPADEIERIQEAANRAATFGFLFAAAPIYLDDVYEQKIVGRPDPKWLNKMTTPELLSLKLDHPANGFPAGTVLTPSSAFAGYTVAPLVDGIADRANLHWSKAAWASAEDGEAPWIELRLPAPHRGGQLRIDFEPSHPSRHLTVLVRTTPEAPWTPARQFTANTDRSVTIPLPAGGYQAIRIEQPADGGSSARPNLLWIAQLSLTTP